MKTYKFLIVLIACGLFQSCSEDESCGYNSTSDDAGLSCTPFGPNNENAGFTVNTAYQRVEETGDWIGGIYDTTLNSQAPPGKDWATHTSPVPVQRPSNWKSSEIGQVFGIAIDADENIYLASSDVYALDSGAFATNSAQQAQLFKCSPGAYTAVPFYQFTTGADIGNDLGNVAYDKVNNQLFVSNLEDGTINRISGLNTASGVLEDQYDPWAADASGAGTIAPQDEQVWAVGVNYEGTDVKVYFPRISNSERSIYSTTLSNGALTSTPAVLEISNIPGTQLKITDISFSSDGQQMLIAERGGAHTSKILSYSKTGASWTSNLQYNIGSFSGENSAGGVDFAYKEVDGDISATCDTFFWGTGNYLETDDVSIGQVYGIQGIEYSGNLPNTAPGTTGNRFTDIFIDNDGILNEQEKSAQGDVEVFDASRCFNLCDF